MRIHVLSDLHLEFGRLPRGVDVNSLDADVTVLAGDISVGLHGLDWALSLRRPVVYVMGNHEFYGQRSMARLWQKAREKVNGTHVHLLDNESIVMDDPQKPGRLVRFIGSTLWTDFCLLGTQFQESCMAQAEEDMNDYKCIYPIRRGRLLSEHGSSLRLGDRLTAKRVLAMHREGRSFIERELRSRPLSSEMSPRGEDLSIVVTHHSPSPRSLQLSRALEQIDAAYASDVEDLVDLADLWIHGHIHVASSYRLNAGRVLANPRGYGEKGAVQGFDPYLTVTI